MVERTLAGGFSALQRFAQRSRQAAEAPQEQCEFCSEPLPPAASSTAHRHLLELATRQIICVCRACSILFDKEAASVGKYRLIRDQRLYLENFELSQAQWESLRIPVEMAFFFYSTPAARVVALYPSAMGVTESLLKLRTWEEVEARNPVLKEMAPDVEALLVNRARGAADHFLVPLDDCYRLVALLRMKWRGLSGGEEVWQEIGRFFADLRKRSKSV